MTSPTRTTERALRGPASSPRRRRARRLIERLRERRRARRAIRHERIRKGLRTPMKKRKAALALSASVMGVGAVASGTMPAAPAAATQFAPDVRKPAPLLSASDELKRAMIEEEGVRYTVYRDVAGYPTVGVGHLVTPADGLSVGDRISEEQALDFLEYDLATAEDAVARLVGDLPLFQHEFDALVDLAYNVGEGNLLPGESPRLNAAIAARDYAGIADELAYHAAGGAVAKGLVYRSERRTNIFTEATYEDPRESGALSNA